MGSFMHINELKDATDINFFLNKTIVIYGQSGSEKMQVLIRLLRLLKDTKWFTSANLWALNETVHETGYNIIFGSDNCYSNFDNFEKWYEDLNTNLSKFTMSKLQMLENPKFLGVLYKLLNQTTVQKTSQKIALFGNDLTQNTILTIWRKTILESYLEIQKNHISFCKGSQCSVCFFCAQKNTLILLDDFGWNAQKHSHGI